MIAMTLSSENLFYRNHSRLLLHLSLATTFGNGFDFIIILLSDKLDNIVTSNQHTAAPITS